MTHAHSNQHRQLRKLLEAVFRHKVLSESKIEPFWKKRQLFRPLSKIGAFWVFCWKKSKRFILYTWPFHQRDTIIPHHHALPFGRWVSVIEIAALFEADVLSCLALCVRNSLSSLTLSSARQIPDWACPVVQLTTHSKSLKMPQKKHNSFSASNNAIFLFLSEPRLRRTNALLFMYLIPSVRPEGCLSEEMAIRATKRRNSSTSHRLFEGRIRRLFEPVA